MFRLSVASVLPLVFVAEQQRRRKTYCHFSSSTYPANNPIEDRFVSTEEHGWKVAAVFDGHGGWQVAEYVSNDLVPTILQNLKNIKETEEIKIDESVSKSFNFIEKSIISAAKPSFKLGFGEVAKVGSCALVALKKADRLVVANLGDCQAILGTRVEGQNHYVPTQISREHNARISLEVLNLIQKHPGENDVVVCKSSHACYVKGRLQLTRAFGDLYLKHEDFNGSPDKSRGRYISDPYTPPYVNHEPDMSHIRLQKEDRFVVLGTDGVWDYLSQQEAVEIVAGCLGNKKTESEAAALIVDRALEIAAAESGMNIHQLKALPQGSKRRNRHDDTTAVVMYF